jgi:RNA polymerase sigma-70 factor (ECF subfamily)
MIRPEQTNLLNAQKDLLAKVYVERRGQIMGYIRKRIGLVAESEDLTQEVFLRLIERPALLVEETLARYIYATARNLVIDYLRRHASSRRAQEYFAQHAPHATRCTEEQIAANELEALEAESIRQMSPRKAEIYLLYIHENQPIDQIASTLRLSRRTVENHIFSARIEVRDALRHAL